MSDDPHQMIECPPEGWDGVTGDRAYKLRDLTTVGVFTVYETLYSDGERTTDVVINAPGPEDDDWPAYLRSMASAAEVVAQVMAGMNGSAKRRLTRDENAVRAAADIREAL